MRAERGSRTGFVFAGMCLVVLAIGPGMARAQQPYPAGGAGPENNPQACSDRVDNDGNGYVDCYDPGCAQFCQQQQQYAPPPQQYAPPPQQYAPPPQYPPPQQYAPPPQQPVYYAPPPAYAPVYQGNLAPRRGIGEIITGAIFLPLGIIFLGASVPLWDAGCVGNYGCLDPSSVGYASSVGAVVLDIFGVAFFLSGLLLIISGAVKEGRYNRWKRATGRAGIINLTPVFASNPREGGGSVGLKFAF